MYVCKHVECTCGERGQEESNGGIERRGEERGDIVQCMPACV